MTEEEATQRRKENAERKEELGRKDQRIEEREGLLMRALLRIEEGERRRAKERQKSSKPPSSDGFQRKGKKRLGSSKAKGGQAGHVGHLLEMVQTPAEGVIHRPSHGEACQCERRTAAGEIQARRHIPDLPVLRLVVTEQHVESLTGSRCQQQTVGSFPSGVQAPAKSGPSVQALAVSWSPSHLLPMERLGEVFLDLLSCRVSEGTVANGRQEAARTLAPTMLVLKRVVQAHAHDHGEETAARVTGRVHGFPVHSPRWFTLSHGHRQRGQKARDAIGIVPASTGRAIPDRCSSADHDAGAHRVCGAHLFRDGLLIAE